VIDYYRGLKRRWRANREIADGHPNQQRLRLRRSAGASKISGNRQVFFQV
jgi:hypothetical protein